MKNRVERKVNGADITVEVTKTTLTSAQVWGVPMEKKAYDGLEITVEKGGKKISCGDKNFFYRLEDGHRLKAQGAFARLGDSYISESTYHEITKMIEEAEAGCEGDEEYKTLKQGNASVTTAAGDTIEETAVAERTAEKIEIAELDARNKKHPGWCSKCHSFCYGDCEANR